MNWQEDLRTAIKTKEQFEKFFEVNLPDCKHPIFFPLHFAKRIKEKGKDSSLWKQFIPNEKENENSGLFDPIGDMNKAQPGQIIHRYRNRVLLLPTSRCPIYCRFCFRQNQMQDNRELFEQNLNKTVDYLNQHSEINEVIFSGGDPLLLSNSKLEIYLKALESCRWIKYIRFHTRMPTVVPKRIDQGLIQLLERASQKFLAVHLALHINHASEWDQEIKKVLELKKVGVNLLSQSVLLKGVNDNPHDLVQLFELLVDHGIRPYYLHHPDWVLGATHFYLPIEKGRKIYAKLRKHLSGWALPLYVIDVEQGKGKVPAFNPESFAFHGKWVT